MKKLASAAALAVALSIFAPAIAGGFEDACVAGAPDGVSDAEAGGFCSCLAEATEGDDGAREDLVASWPVEDQKEWLNELSGSAADAASSCIPG